MFENWSLNYRNCDLSCTTEFYVDEDESYNNPNVQNVIQFSGTSTWKIGSSTTVQTYPSCYITNRDNTQWRVALYITTTGDAKAYLECLHKGGASGSYGARWSYKNNGGTTYYDIARLPDVGYDYWSGSYATNKAFTFSTNIPFFGTDKTHAQEYVNCTDDAQAKQLLKTYAYNFKEPDTSPDGDYFEINNCWTYGEWITDTQPQVSQINFRNFRGKMTGGKFALYDIEGINDNKLKIGVKNDATFYDMKYSLDGHTWTATDTFPFEFFYRRRKNELGEFGYALTFTNTKIPKFDDETQAQGYLDGTVRIEESNNWSEISNQYPAGSAVGDARETATTFGQVYTRAMFSQLYLCDISALEEISNDLFDYDVTTLSGIWADIKKGIEMYGTDPMQVVQSLRYYPFDISQYFSNVSSQNYIYFGAYQLALQNSSVKKVIYANGYIDLGSTYIKRWYKDWRDFEPYTKLSIYLPYVGMFPLDAKKYYGKSVLIRYFIDLRTGACTACLIADNVLIDYFDGIIGTEMPITLTDYSSYAQSQLNIIMRNAGLGIASEATAGNLASKVIGASLNYNNNAQAVEEAAQMSPLSSSLSAQTASSYGKQAIVGAVAGSTALVGGVAVGTAMKTSFDLMKNGTAGHTKTKPASSAMINQYLPQYPFFRLEVMEIDESPYLNALYGRPTNASGLILDFDGYLECEDVSLICPIATDNERQEIIDLLKTGIYITPP